MFSRLIAAFAATALVLVDTTHAHSFMIDPMPTWIVNFPTNSPSGLIHGQEYLPCPKNMSYATHPTLNTEAYWIAFKASKYTSLKDLADQTAVLQEQAPFGNATRDCGFSISNGTARDLPPQVKWNEFGDSHQGPCEVWCDDKLAFTDPNCALSYPTKPAVLPYDIKVCKGAKRMQSYWIALHGLPWQLYLNCVPLKRGGYSGGPSAKPTSPPKPTPETPEAGSTPSPESETPYTDTSDASDTETPDTNDTESPYTDTSDASDTETPDTNDTESPYTETSDASDTETPDTNDTESPHTSDTEAPEVVKSDVTPVAPTVEPAPETNVGADGAKCVRRRK